MSGLSLQNIRDGVRKMLGVDQFDLIDADLDLLINQSWWQIADEFDFKEKETVRTYNTVIGTSGYATAADVDGLQEVSIEDTYSSEHSLLSPMTLLTYESGFVNTTNAYTKPEFYVRRANLVTLYPTPDKIYKITEYYWKTLTDLSATNAPSIPQAWHEIIKYGAAYRAFADFGDFNRSRAARQMQVELMSTKETVNTKEHADRPYAGIHVLRPRYR